jgi:hypothetical protein
MKKETLEDFISTVEKDCAEHSIQVFYGTYQDIDLLPDLLVDDQRKDWNHYLQIIKSLGVQLVTIATEVNEIGDLDYLREKVQKVEEEDRRRYQEAFDIFEKNGGKVMRAQIHFYYQSVCYQFSKDADWYCYNQVLDRLFDIEDDDLEDEDEFRPAKNYLPDEEIERIARLIVAKPAYVNARNSVERSRVLFSQKEMVDVMHHADRCGIQYRAEEIFQAEVYPKQEARLKNEILDLKRKGLKKVHIKSKLSINDQTLNRHYYED